MNDTNAKCSHQPHIISSTQVITLDMMHLDCEYSLFSHALFVGSVRVKDDFSELRN